MSRIADKLLALIFVGLFAVTALTAQASEKKNEKAVAEINSLRRRTVELIQKRDRAALREIYAEDFSHTHASGKVDDKRTRLDVLVSGEKTIDTALAEDVSIKIFGEQTAVATGKSTLTSGDGTATTYRWTIVYAKIGKKWTIAASQATKLTE